MNRVLKHVMAVVIMIISLLAWTVLAVVMETLFKLA